MGLHFKWDPKILYDCWNPWKCNRLINEGQLNQSQLADFYSANTNKERAEHIMRSALSSGSERAAVLSNTNSLISLVVTSP